MSVLDDRVLGVPTVSAHGGQGGAGSRGSSSGGGGGGGGSGGSGCGRVCGRGHVDEFLLSISIDVTSVPV